ncbi:MAG: hypothetical protein QW753_06635, partial [Thermofilum sp.]
PEAISRGLALPGGSLHHADPHPPSFTCPNPIYGRKGRRGVAPGRVVPALERRLAHPLHSLHHRVSGVERLASRVGGSGGRG